MARKPETYAGAAEKVRAALELMNHGGRHWIKGAFRRKVEDGEWGYCILGGLKAAGATRAQKEAACEQIRKEADRLYPLPGSKFSYILSEWSVPGFNDSSRTTWRHVKTVLNAAAKKLDKLAEGGKVSA